MGLWMHGQAVVTQGPPGNLYARFGHVGLFLGFLFSKDFATKVLTLCSLTATPAPSSHRFCLQCQPSSKPGKEWAVPKRRGMSPRALSGVDFGAGAGGEVRFEDRLGGGGPMPQDVQLATGCGAHSTVSGISLIIEGDEIISA